MKIKVLSVLVSVAVFAVAQTVFVPQRIDWRYRLTWEDPNPPGLVSSWIIYASNNVAVRSASTRSMVVDLQPLLNGAPAGAYALFGVPVSTEGDIGDAGTNHFVLWPGGNGHIRGPVKLDVGK